MTVRQVETGRGRQRSGEWGRALGDHAGGEWYPFTLDIGINNGGKAGGWEEREHHTDIFSLC